MLIRALMIAAFAITLAGCGEQERDRPDCCAIKPSSRCEGDLLGNGVTHAEMDLLLGEEDAICPSATLSEDRIHEIAPIWAASDACQATRGYERLRALEDGLCPARSLAGAPRLPPGVDLDVATACAAGLTARGLSHTEIWVVLGAPEDVCPKGDVTEQRLRDIMAKDWTPANCTQFTAEQMLKAMNSGACGGKAG